MFKRITTIITAPLLLMGLIPLPVLAAGSANEIEDLRHRLEKLEGREKEAEGFTILSGLKTLTVTGAIEVEGVYAKTKNMPGESSINVATALINFDVAPSERVSGRIAFLHEDGEVPDAGVDEAYLSYSRRDTWGGNLSFTAGLLYLPFGAFNSEMISDPLTLELGEANRNLLLTDWERGMFSMQLGVYNGDHDTTGHDVIDNGVLAVNVTPSEKVGFGISYICDIAETNANLLADATAEYDNNVNAASAFLTLGFSPVTVNLEYLGAFKEFSEAMVADPNHAAELTGRKPRAWFGEIVFNPDDNWAFSGRYEKAKDYQDDVARYGATVSYGLDVNTVISLEYLYSDFDLATENKASQMTLQLAMEF